MGDYEQCQDHNTKGKSLDVTSADPETTREAVPRNTLGPEHTAPPQLLQGLGLTDYLPERTFCERFLDIRAGNPAFPHLSGNEVEFFERYE